MKHYPKTITPFFSDLVMHELFMYSHVQFLYILFYALYFALFLDFEQNKEIFQRKGIYSGEILSSIGKDIRDGLTFLGSLDEEDGSSEDSIS